MGQVLLGLGLVLLAATVAATLTIGSRRTRLALSVVALALAALLIVADNWEGARISDLRDQPLIAMGGIAFLLVIVALIARLFATRPRLAIVAAVAVVPFRIPIELGGSSANLLLPLYVVIAAALLAAVANPGLFPRGPLAPGDDPGRASRRPADLIGAALAMFVVVYALQALYADDLSGAVENVAFFFAPFAALFLICASADWDQRLLRMAGVLILVEAIVVALVGFGQYATGELFWNDKVISGNEAHAWFRVNSLFWDPNILGRYLAVTMLLLAAVVAWAARPRPALLAAGAFLVLLAGLAITFSQTGMIALLGGIVVLVLVRWGPARAALALAAVVVAMGAAALATETDGPGGGTSGRTGLVSGGLELAADRPLAGYGSGSFASEFKQRFGGGDGIAVASHTEPVTVAAEQGAIGLLAYGALLATALAALALAAGVGRGPGGTPFAAFSLAALTLMFVHSLGYAAFFTDPISWALLALAAALPAAATLPVREVVGTAAA